MAEKQIRLLKANEIECRIGRINDKGLSLLLYKNARADMKILDETFGPMNWQRYHEIIGDNLFCTVEVWDEEKRQWIQKQDVGTKSYTEQEKGEASDAFKRACVSLGIGRELYTAPSIWIRADAAHIQTRDNRSTCYDRFSVREISYNDDREISGLIIVNQDGEVVFKMNDAVKSPNKAHNDHVSAINRELERTGVALDTVLQRYGLNGIDEMDDSTFQKAMNSLKRTRSKAA